MKKSLLLLLLLALFTGCYKRSDSVIVASLLSSDFPSDLDVPMVSGSPLLNGTTAFIAQDNPLAVLPVNVSTGTLASSFYPVDLSFLRPSGGSIYGSDLFIATETLGALCYSGNEGSGAHITGVALFNPSTGDIYCNIDCRRLVGTTFYQTVDYDSASDVVSYRTVNNYLTSFASGVVILGSTLYVSTSNLDTGNYSTYYPGTVFVFDIFNLYSPSPPTTIFTGPDGIDPNTRYFNPTQVSLYGSKILLVSAGATEFNSSYQSVVKTNGALEIIDSATNTITNSFSLGLAAPGSEEVKIYQNGASDDIAVLASQVFGRLYRVNLTTPIVINDANTPIVINGYTSDEILSVAPSLDNQYFFVSSQKDDKIHVVTISSTDATPATPTIVRSEDPRPGSTYKSFPSNLEILPASGGSQRVLFTTGQPPEVRKLSHP